jgi:hypothetical protein
MRDANAYHNLSGSGGPLGARAFCHWLLWPAFFYGMSCPCPVCMGKKSTAILRQRFSCASFVYERVTVVAALMLITSAMLPFAARLESNE